MKRKATMVFHPFALLRPPYRAIMGAALLGILCWLLPQATFAASKDAPPLVQTVCKDTTLQTGWVIVDVLTDPHRCSGSIFNPNNVWAITKPTGPTSVCSNSPVPSGFVVTSQGTDMVRCPGVAFLPNIMTITPITGYTTITICASSPVPAGFVVTGEYRLLDRPQAGVTCSSDGATAAAFATTARLNALVQKTIQRSTNGSMQVCADSPLPPRYTVRQRNIYLASCSRDPGASLLIVPPPSSHWNA